jgi:hypothetical protein
MNITFLTYNSNAFEAKKEKADETFIFFACTLRGSLNPNKKAALMSDFHMLNQFIP